MTIFRFYDRIIKNGKAERQNAEKLEKIFDCSYGDGFDDDIGRLWYSQRS
ncbi:hypothetical protein INF28_02870 [Oscillospiraceae bacterium DSM 107454]|uniref:Uncharacterized protein n=1 Tax=Ructibacterium gallinarum TaxID=2779355 RepID=A0A9D5LX36_9FIRM|nr:hypothetical protein [Ructibacterium gallinarum]